jgi:hypothetical protein
MQDKSCHTRFEWWPRKRRVPQSTVLHGYTNPRWLKFVLWCLTISAQLVNFFLVTKICISSHAPSRQCQVMVRFTGNSQIMGPPYGTCFMSPFWHLGFEGGSQILEILWIPPAPHQIYNEGSGQHSAWWQNCYECALDEEDIHSEISVCWPTVLLPITHLIWYLIWQFYSIKSYYYTQEVKFAG